MAKKVEAAAVQFNIKLGDVDQNLATASRGLRSVAESGAQLAVLPEMWSTGYDYRRLPELSERTPEVVEAIRQVSEQTGLVVVGSLPTKVDGEVYNTAYVIDKGQLLDTYSKLHLFSTMGEDRFLAAGNEMLVTDTSVGKVGVAICYDLRFPEFFRNMALQGAEIICVPAEWPKPRQEHWRTLLRARAIENQLFIAASNCCGIQGKLDFFGMSILIAPRGEVLAEGGEADTNLTATFDFAEMAEYRQQIRALADRRPEIYGERLTRK